VFKVNWAWPMIITWLCAMVFAFWWFEYRHWQLFDAKNVLFNGQQLSLLQQRLTPSPITTVVHFSDDTCPCSRYSEPHIQKLQPLLKKARQITLGPKDALMKNVFIPATPSVAVWDAQGELAYFGPYSSGMMCGSGQDFVSRVMDSLANTKNPKWINTAAVGCYCPWLI